MTTQNLWQMFFYVFRCFDSTRKPAYIQDDATSECSNLINSNNPTYSFVIIR